MTEERITSCPDPEACVGMSEPCIDHEKRVKMAEPPLEVVISDLRNDLHRVQEECGRLGRERDLLADMYARERFENNHLRDMRKFDELNVREMREAAYNLRRILLNESRVRMNKETRAEISKYLSF